TVNSEVRPRPEPYSHQSRVLIDGSCICFGIEKPGKRAASIRVQRQTGAVAAVRLRRIEHISVGNARPVVMVEGVRIAVADIESEILAGINLELQFVLLHVLADEPVKTLVDHVGGGGCRTVIRKRCWRDYRRKQQRAWWGDRRIIE